MSFVFDKVSPERASLTSYFQSNTENTKIISSYIRIKVLFEPTPECVAFGTVIVIFLAVENSQLGQKSPVSLSRNCHSKQQA